MRPLESPRLKSPFFLHPAVVFAAVGVAGSWSIESPLPTLLVAFGWLLLGPKSWGKKRFAWGAALFVISGLRAQGAVETFEEARVDARDALGRPQRCAGTFEVITSPTERTEPAPVKPTKSVEPEAAMSHAHGGECEPDIAVAPTRISVWTGRTERLECEDADLPGPFVVRLSGGPRELARGDVVDVVAGLGPIQLFRNASLPNPTAGAARRGAVLSGAVLGGDVTHAASGGTARIDRLRARVRSRIDATYPEVTAPLARALVLGESDLETGDATAFSKSGLLHLLAVSGTHLVIAVLALVGALRAALVRSGFLARRYDVVRFSSASGALLGCIYADFAGGSGSAWRAAFMLCVVLGGRALGFKLSGSFALGASILIGLTLDPLVGSDLSFLLSALATAGLIGIGQPLAKLCERGLVERAPLKQLVGSLVATVSATIPCAPALAFIDGQMTFAALFANVIAGPLGELVALPACLLHALSSAFPSLELGLARVGSGALYAVRGIALGSAGIEWAQFDVPLPSGFGIAGTLAVVALATRWPRTRERIACAVVAFVVLEGASTLGQSRELELPVVGRSRQLVVTALDVGQGDALALEFPNGFVALVDGGGFPGGIPDTGERVLLPWARSRDLKQIDLVVLSHAHPDHLLGLATLARRVRIAEFWHPAASPAWGDYAEVMERVKASGGRVLGPAELCAAPGEPRPAALDPARFGGAVVEVLAPCPGPEGGGANDESLVMRVGYGRRRALFTGDIEAEGEARLVRTAADRLVADLFKVPHHGSHTSSSRELLEHVRPSLAVISSGVRNRFDHPRAVTLERLASHGIVALRTDRLGSVSWATDGEEVTVQTFSP